MIRAISYLFIVFFLSTLLNSAPVFAADKNTSCPNRFVTIVNPIRSRDLWFDRTLQPLDDQYNYIKLSNYAATWLVQFDVLKDPELLNRLKAFNKKQEIGVFLEISPKLADSSKVIYPYNSPWFYPNAVFLSGYSQSDRRKLIDQLFQEFKEQFGAYPKSVGAWWIDSYSLEYIKSHYKIATAMIVADQLTTDNYGVWGQWWGLPYYPSKANILTPASSIVDKQKVTIIQWAQRDPKLAYGEGPAVSNFSLQANDYIRQGKNTEYFKAVASSYLDCQNPLGQITVGLETGQESVGYIGEYGNQLAALKTFPGLQVVSMQEFGKLYAKTYPHLPPSQKLTYQDSVWELSSQNRVNTKLNDMKVYEPGISFQDYFVADKNNFLNRVLPDKNELKYHPNLNFLFLVILLILGILAIRIKKINVWVASLLFTMAAFGLVLRSGLQYGWQVFYGPVISDLSLWKIFIVLVIFLIFFYIGQLKFLKTNFKMLFIWLMPLTFGLDFLIRALRYSFISQSHYFGFAVNDLRFLGISIAKNWQIGWVNREFPAYQAAALIRLDYGRIWDNLWLAFLVYPLIHVLGAILLTTALVKIPKKVRLGILIFLSLLLTMQLFTMFQADPRVALPESFSLKV